MASIAVTRPDTPIRVSVRSRPGAANWRLLLQFDTDDDLGVMWGDAGVIYYWVEAPAALAGRFENAWLILQCH